MMPQKDSPSFLQLAEDGLLVVSLFLMALIPVVEFAGRRWFGAGIAGASDYLRHLTLWVGFIGAAAASREGRHLRIVSDTSWLPPKIQVAARCYRALFLAVVCFALAAAVVELVVSEAPMGLEPVARHFPRRNRIIAGLSRAVPLICIRFPSASRWADRCTPAS